MICKDCGQEIPEGEENNYYGTILCEDCYLERLTRPKPCDPMAVRSARITREALGQKGAAGLNDIQKKIIQLVQEKGKITKPDLAKELGLDERDLEKHFAVLRHCELVRAFKDGQKIYLTLMD